MKRYYYRYSKPQRVAMIRELKGQMAVIHHFFNQVSGKGPPVRGAVGDFAVAADHLRLDDSVFFPQKGMLEKSTP